MYKILLTTALAILTGCSTVKDLDYGDLAKVVKDEVKEQQEASRPPKDLQEEISRMPQRWLGKDYSDLPVTVNLRSAKFERIHVRFDHDSLPWPKYNPTDRSYQEQQANCIAGYVRDGVLVVGWYDYYRAGSKLSGMQPFEKGHNGHRVPAKGEVVYFCLVDLKGTERSNWCSDKWQGRR